MTDERSIEAGAQRVPIIVDIELHPRFVGLPGVYDRPSLRGEQVAAGLCACKCGSESGSGSGG